MNVSLEPKIQFRFSAVCVGGLECGASLLSLVDSKFPQYSPCCTVRRQPAPVTIVSISPITELYCKTLRSPDMSTHCKSLEER